jgi:hypothetical protein
MTGIIAMLGRYFTGVTPKGKRRNPASLAEAALADSRRLIRKPRAWEGWVGARNGKDWPLQERFAR